ncbi:CocE/NonD family hydrolase [Candidatus Sumerlaeota bacterium]|nr:CocE/NonD family hydrolase [Candidatus Sumerlaeota bacterium]
MSPRATHLALISLALMALGVGACLAAAVLTRTEMVPMRDGIRLATDLYLPPGTTARPTVLTRTPYGRADRADQADLYVPHGIAFVAQDTRGRGGSEGEDETFWSDGWGALQDGYDTIQWIASQEWSNGRVMCQGSSGDGFTGILAAGAAPPAMAGAIVDTCPCDLYHDSVYTGGAFRRSLVLGWLALQDAESRLPDLVAHPTPTSWWDPVRIPMAIPSVDVPVCFISGWFDLYVDAALRTAVQLDALGGGGARGRQLVIIGPWQHTAIGSRDVGELTFPENAVWTGEINDLTLDFTAEALLGTPTGIFDQPMFTYYMMGDVDDPTAPGNEWRTSDVWPPQGEVVTLHLCPGGLLSAEMAFDPVSTETSFVCDPANPVPTLGGRNLWLTRGPYDQSALEQGSDVVTFSTPPLSAPFEIAGMVTCRLFVSSTAPDADLLVKLCDVYPDGRSMLMCEGALRMRRRNGWDQEDMMITGEICEVEIPVGQIALALNTGHRLRITIASTNSPRFEVNPQTGAPLLLDDPVTQIATHTIHHSDLCPSLITLPSSSELMVPAEMVGFFQR